LSNTPGPPLAALTRRLAGIPADFLDPATVVPAVLGDAVFMVHTAVLRAADIETVRGWCATQHGRDATAVAAWLIAEPQLVAYTRDQGPAGALALARALVELAAEVAPARWLVVAERREESARTALFALGLHPSGESATEAADRLWSVSTVARRAAMHDAAAAERRARDIAAALAARRAKEAAAQYVPT